MKRNLAILLAVLTLSSPAYAQQWDRVNGAMQVRSGPTTPLVIIDQTNATANSKILSLRANASEKCSIDIDGDLVCTGTFTLGSTLTVTTDGLGTTSTAGITAQNTTAAAAGAQQISPGFDLVGQGWKTDATAASQEVRFRTEVLPVQGTVAPSGTWKLKSSIAGSAFVEVVTVTSAGVVTAPVSLNAPDVNIQGTGGRFRSTTNGTHFTLPANGQAVLNNNGATATIGLNIGAAANGQAFGLVNTLTELTTIAAAATTDTTIQMPANSVVLGVSVRVTTVIPDATSFSVGDSGSATRFSTANVSTAANSTDPGTKAGAYYNASALSVRLTMNGGTPAANTGRVRVTIYYYTITPPTS